MLPMIWRFTMRRILVSGLFVVVSALLSLAQPPTRTAPWAVSLPQNTTAASTITVANQCRNNHEFQIQAINVPFLTLSVPRVQVAGGQTQVTSVQFNTSGMTPGVHQGQVNVVCLTCRREPTCTQDREVLQLTLTVVTPANDRPQPNPNVFDPKPVVETDADRRTRSLIPNVTGVLNSFLKGPCPQKEADCEKLRQKAAELEQAANEAQVKADAAKMTADEAEAKAKAAEATAKAAENAAQPGAQGGSITSDGETFTEADNAWLEAKKKKLFDDWQAGRITAGEQQAQREALSGPEALKKAREERLAHEAKLRKEAEEAKAAADKAKADAAKAKADADAAKKAADAAKVAADAALEAYKKCLKEIEDECLRAAAEKKRRDDEAAAAAQRAADDAKRKKEADDRAKALQDEIDYLLENFKRLGLITRLPTAGIPDPLDPAFDALQQLTGETVRNFLQSVAGQVGGGPLDPTYITALGEAYKAMSALFNMRTKAGLERVHRLLTTKINNPKTGKPYTENEAWNKIKRMEDLMDKIKAKLAAAGK